MNGAVAKRTQEILGKVIKKPPLSEKLLSKPPFRYLHDIVSEVIRTTGFMKGLYEEAEMKSDNVKDKDSKMAFLQKAIDVVMLVSGEPVAAKPARIVAGHEPEKTNELLQTIAKCCLNKLSSDEAVRHVLSGDKVDLKGKASTSKSQGKENREEKIKENSVNTEQKDPDRPKDEESRKKAEKPRERDRTKDRDRDKDKSRDRDKEKVPDRGRDQEKEKDKDRDRTKDKEREKNRERDSHKERERVRDKDREREREKRRGRERGGRELQKENEEKKKENEEKKTRAAVEVSKPKTQPEKPNRNNKAASGQPERDDLDEPSEVSPHQPSSSLRIPRPSSAKGQRRRPKSGAPGDSDSDGAGGENTIVDKPVHLENGDASDAMAPHTSHSTSSRRISRPSSARPAPPRVRRPESHTDAGPAERLGSAQPASAVIIDGKKLSEDEDDDDNDGQFVVEEAGPLSTDMPELEMRPSVDFQDNEKHGGLVKKILETKKDYESSPSALMSKDQDRMPMLEAARKKERELVAKEIERLRTSVQSVCRSALPLGKIMDYIQEDMDSMQNELQNWRRENREHVEALLQEQRITDSAVKPLAAELVELDQLIMEQQDKICAIKSNILQNEEKIRKMVSRINNSKT